MVLVLTGTAVCWLAVSPCRANMLLNPAFNVNLVNLGSVSLPVTDTTGYTYQGLAFAGQNLLLADWNPAQISYPGTSGPFSEVLWQVAGNANSLTGSAFATVPTSTNFPYSIDVGGGLASGPGGVLFYSTTQGNLGEYFNGTSMLVSLTDPLNSAAGVSALGFLPIGTSSQLVVAFAGTNNWYLVSLAPNANGLYNASVGSLLFSGIEATSFVYTPAAPSSGFATAGILVGDSATQMLSFYGLNAQGNVTGPGTYVIDTSGNGSIPGYGLARDPNTGDFLFTTNDNNTQTGQIWELQLSTPEPCTALTALIACLWLWRRRRSVIAPPS